MIQEEFTFLSHDGKTQIHGVKFVPDDRKWDKVLQLIHGMQEYILRYKDFAEYLTKKGYLVVGHDHLGHGDSISSEKEMGFFCKDGPSDVLVEDMHTLREQIQKENPGKPYFMLGHSMGSYMLRKYITLHGENLSGALLVGTGSMPDLTMKTGMALCRGIAAVFGWHFRSPFVRFLSLMGPYREFDSSGRKPEKSWLTKDLEIVEKYFKDEKCVFRFTINGYYGLMEAVYYDNQPKNIDKIPKDLPIFLASGDKDPVGDFGAGVKNVYRQYRRAGIKDVKWKLYQNDRHEILNETDRKVVYHNLLSWMEAHL